MSTAATKSKYTIDTDDGRIAADLNYIAWEIWGWMARVEDNAKLSAIDIANRVRHAVNQLHEQGGDQAVKGLIAEFMDVSFTSNEMFKFVLELIAIVLPAGGGPR